MRRITTAAGTGLVAAWALAAAAAMPSAYADDRLVFRLQSPDITESSSLVVSTVDPSLAYTANDSGDLPVVYVIDTATGSVVGRMTLEGVDAVDIEALAGGEDGTLIVADIGDNDIARTTVTAYRVRQPVRGDTVVSPEAVKLAYADGPRDAESVLYDDTADRIYVVSKELVGASVYATAPGVFARERAPLQRVADAPPVATDATLLPGGDFAVVRTYGSAAVYRFPSFEHLSNFELPVLKQGESIAAPPRGGKVWVGTEGKRSPVLAVPLPQLPPPRASPSTSTPPSPGATPSTTAPPRADPSTPAPEDIEADGPPSGQLVLVGLGFAIALLLVVAVISVARRRRHT